MAAFSAQGRTPQGRADIVGPKTPQRPTAPSPGEAHIRDTGDWEAKEAASPGPEETSVK